MTVSLSLDEVIVDAVIAKLQAGWASRIQAINVEKDDGMICAAPDPSMYFLGRMEQLPACPACFVLPGSGQFQESGPHSMRSIFEIQVHVVDQDMNGPLLARRLMRQARAVIEVIYDDDPMEALYRKGGGSVLSAYRIFPTRTIPGSVFQPSGDGGWRNTYLIVFRAEQEES